MIADAPIAKESAVTGEALFRYIIPLIMGGVLVGGIRDFGKTAASTLRDFQRYKRKDDPRWYRAARLLRFLVWMNVFYFALALVSAMGAQFYAQSQPDDLAALVLAGCLVLLAFVLYFVETISWFGRKFTKAESVLNLEP